MGRTMKFVVMGGALAGVVGLFLPLASAGAGDGVLALGLSLWSGAAVTGLAPIAYAFLGLLAGTGGVAALSIGRSFGRGAAVAALLLSVGPALVSWSWVSKAAASGAIGSGLVLIAAGATLAVLASIAALARPEPRRLAAVPT